MKRKRRDVRIQIFWYLACLLLIGIAVDSEAQSDMTDAEPESEIAYLMEQAETRFQNQEFVVSYELYQRVLLLEPAHTEAREKIYKIAEIYQQLEIVARHEKDEEKAQFFHTQYRNIIRYVLSILTAQLERSIKEHATLKKAEQERGESQTAIIDVLENIVHILDDLQGIYQKFPPDNENAHHMVERIGKTITKYQEELTQYK